MGLLMKLSIKKGQEGHVVVSTNIFDENIYAYRAYKKAGQALGDFILRSKKLRRKALSAGQGHVLSAETLYLFGQNIIAFSGHRGQGKTSAMLSMCSALKNTGELSGLENGELTADIKDCRFSILQPIDPTCLENSQDILSLILSRMYRYVLDIFEQREAGGHMRDGFERYSEFQKNELFIKFQSCLSSINAAKGKGQGKGIENMSMLDDYSDGAILKQKFFELVDLILDLEYGERNRENHFMVIQLDDTDFQIDRGYEIMEDIRKYLTLPNIIIFMATDISLLRKGIIQHYLKDFETNIKHLDNKNSNGSAPNGKGVVNEIREIGGKYLAKLIPPAYIAHLPHLDELVRDNTEDIELEYVGENNEDLLPHGNGTGYSFQSSILRYIYQKTHIVFIAPERYMHNIIPTTLRGLVQLLKLLSDMKDVPEISDANMSEAATLVGALKEQIPILQRNIQLFEDYFLNDWVPAKLLPEDQNKIARLCDTVPRNYNRIIQELITSKKGNESVTYADTIACIEDDRKRCCSQSDFYYCYALCTYLTLEYNKIALREKLKAVKTYKSGLFVVDYDLRKNDLPASYVDINLKKDEEFDFLYQCDGNADYALRNIWKASLPDDLFNFWLSLGRFYKNDKDNDVVVLPSNGVIQSILFETQESVICMATNWDIQHQIYEFCSNQGKENWNTIEKIVYNLQMKLTEINNGDTNDSMICAMNKEDVVKALERIVLATIPDKHLRAIISESCEKAKDPKSFTVDEKINILSDIVTLLGNDEKKYEMWIKNVADSILTSFGENILNNLLEYSELETEDNKKDAAKKYIIDLKENLEKQRNELSEQDEHK